MSHGNWGRWGESDQAGAGNLQDEGVAQRGLSAARTGRVVSLAQPLGPATPVPLARRPPIRFMERTAGDYSYREEQPGAFHFAEDTVMLPAHAGTHLDALAHTWAGDTLYNGHPANRVQARSGAARCGAEHLAAAVTRGVLLDFVVAGELSVDAEARIGPGELEAACERGGIELAPGDAVLLRTGWWDRHGTEPGTYFYTSPGLTPSGADWLAARDPILVGADTCAVEALPFPDGTIFPAHLILIHEHGIPLLENLALAPLAQAGRSEFLFITAPLPLVGSTGSPVNPLAVL